MKWIQPAQKYQFGGTTLLDPHTGQAMHSDIGSELESRLIFFEGSKFQEKINQPSHNALQSQSFNLWDIGMGFGMNALQAWDYVHSQTSETCPNRQNLRIESFEPHLEGIRFALENSNNAPPLFQKWKKTLSTLLRDREVTLGTHSWRLHEKDYIEVIDQLSSADLVFYDLYCPKIDHSLWSTERFKFLRKYCNGLLITYSAATWVRTNLLFAGFFIERGPGTPLKLESTRAWTHKEWALRAGAQLLNEKWLEKVRRSSRAFSTDYQIEDFDKLYAKLICHPQFMQFDQSSNTSLENQSAQEIYNQ